MVELCVIDSRRRKFCCYIFDVIVLDFFQDSKDPEVAIVSKGHKFSLLVLAYKAIKIVSDW